MGGCCLECGERGGREATSSVRGQVGAATTAHVVQAFPVLMPWVSPRLPSTWTWMHRVCGGLGVAWRAGGAMQAREGGKRMRVYW